MNSTDVISTRFALRRLACFLFSSITTVVVASHLLDLKNPCNGEAVYWTQFIILSAMFFTTSEWFDSYQQWYHYYGTIHDNIPIRLRIHLARFVDKLDDVESSNSQKYIVSLRSRFSYILIVAYIILLLLLYTGPFIASVLPPYIGCTNRGDNVLSIISSVF